MEAWRDSLLDISGRLDRTMGGESTNLSDENNVRRTVYAKVSRHQLDNLLRLFDFPDANITGASGLRPPSRSSSCLCSIVLS